jgi:hypothetical protein
MQILKTTLIQFDEIAERTRLKENFKGPLKTSLLAILDSFVTCDWVTCHERLRKLNRTELEYVNEVIYTVMRARFDRNTLLEAHPDGEGVAPEQARQLDYPRFQVGTFID